MVELEDPLPTPLPPLTTPRPRGWLTPRPDPPPRA